MPFLHDEENGMKRCDLCDEWLDIDDAHEDCPCGDDDADLEENEDEN